MQLLGRELGEVLGSSRQSRLKRDLHYKRWVGRKAASGVSPRRCSSVKFSLTRWRGLDIPPYRFPWFVHV